MVEVYFVIGFLILAMAQLFPAKEAKQFALLTLMLSSLIVITFWPIILVWAMWKTIRKIQDEKMAESKKDS